MTRLSLAFMLALGAHILFLFLVLPGRHDETPKVLGIRQVKVSIDRVAPEPVADVRETVEEIEPAREEVEQEVPAEVPPEAVEVQSEPLQPVELQVKERKKKVADKVPLVEQPAPQPEITKKELVAEDVQVQQLSNEPTRPAQPVSNLPAAAPVRQAAPLYEVNRPPEYPVLARRRGWEGTVMLQVNVTAGGNAREVRVHTSSSYDLLDDAALDAVENWLFSPGTEGGRPCAMTVLVPIHFVLQDAP